VVYVINVVGEDPWVFVRVIACPYLPFVYTGVPVVLEGLNWVKDSTFDPLKLHKRAGWGAALI